MLEQKMNPAPLKKVSVKLRVLIFLDDEILAQSLSRKAKEIFETSGTDLTPEVFVLHSEQDFLETLLSESGIGQLIVLSKNFAHHIEKVRSVLPESKFIIMGRDFQTSDTVDFMRNGAEDVLDLAQANAAAYVTARFQKSLKKVVARALALGTDEVQSTYGSVIQTCQLISSTLDETSLFSLAMQYLKKTTQCTGLGLYEMQSDRWDRIETDLDSNVDVLDVVVEWSQVFQKMVQDQAEFRVLPKSLVGPEVIVFQFQCVGARNYYVVCSQPSLSHTIEELVSLFRILSSQVRLTGKQIESFRDVTELLYKDDVTGLFNARFLSEFLDQAFARQKLKSSSFAVMFLDVDHFKQVNDSNGHLVGTHLLCEMGQVVEKVLRRSDVICRYGGDEFVIILEGISKGEAVELAEDVRKTIEKHVFLEKEGLALHLTVSIGVAVCPDHAKTRKEILEAADAAMYSAKRAQRNHVFVAQELIRAA